MMTCEIRAANQTPETLLLAGPCTVTIQPAGPVGNRNVFVSLSAGPGSVVELVLLERLANQLGEALVSGSVGIMRDFDVSV
jgi:hypothetical protein